MLELIALSWPLAVGCEPAYAPIAAYAGVSDNKQMADYDLSPEAAVEPKLPMASARNQPETGVGFLTPYRPFR